MDFRQLLPHPATVDVNALLATLTDGLALPADRPYTFVNFVESMDGRAAVHGRSSALGDDGDGATFHGLREQVDAVLVGTGTLRAENYGRILGTPERRERRLAAGRTAEPLACIVSRSGQVPRNIPLFAEPEARVIVFTPHELEMSGIAAQVEVVVLGPESLTFHAAARHLRAAHGIRTLLCEGGPTVFGALLAEGLVDELFLTLAPKLAGGGDEPAITSGPELPSPRELAIRWLLERNGSLYLRYSLR
jgi:riboflavin-specific deaminase-like protein